MPDSVKQMLRDIGMDVPGAGPGEPLRSVS
jgi:hypothetical protein